MTACTKCGKPREWAIVINTTPLTFTTYLNWKEDNKGLCIDCFVDDSYGDL